MGQLSKMVAANGASILQLCMCFSRSALPLARPRTRGTAGGLFLRVWLGFYVSPDQPTTSCWRNSIFG